MCGRFVSITNKNNVRKIFNIYKINNYSKFSYNVSPSQNINVILNYKNELNIDSIKWGYSFFNKKTNSSQFVINSRIETINEKYLFKESFLKRKCVVVANGYYEWREDNNLKVPYFISVPVLETIFFAAIWRIELIDNMKTKVCCIITKEAYDKVKFIHHRMPIIFSNNEALTYLKDNKNEFINNFQNNNIDQDLDFYPVSKIINNPNNNYKECIKSLK